jgi:hypothetical protein
LSPSSATVVQLALWILSEEVVGDSQRQLPVAMQLLDDAVVIRVILKLATPSMMLVKPSRFSSRMK